MKLNDICPICYETPGSHSFDKICELGGVCMMYTKPSSATKYKDQAGILRHVENMLASIGDKKWSWTIDGEGFSLKHATEVGTIQKILEIIKNKYISTLVSIKVLNMNNAIRHMYTLISPFVDGTLDDKIVWR